jgi:hypothetical protein
LYLNGTLADYLRLHFTLDLGALGSVQVDFPRTRWEYTAIVGTPAPTLKVMNIIADFELC